MRDIAFLAFFVAYLPAMLRYPHLGAMVWAWIAFFSPDQYMWSFMANVPLSKVIVAVTLLSMVINPGRKRVYLDGIILLGAAFLAQGLISASLSLTLFSVNWDLFSKLAKVLALALVLTIVLTNRRRVYGLILAVVLGLQINAVIEGLKVISSGGGHHINGTLAIGDNNQFALAILMAMPLTWYLFNSSRNRWLKWAWAGTLALSVIAVIGTYSRGGFIGLSALAVIFVLYNQHRVRNVAIMAAAALLMYQLAPATWFARIDTISAAENGQDSSFNGRLVAWHIAEDIAQDRPFYGAGFHAMQDPRVWSTYARDLTESALATDPDSDVAHARAAHSIYFEVLGDLGYTGLLLFVWMILAAIFACHRTRRMARSRPDLAWAVQLAAMIEASLLIYLLAGAALSMAYFELLYILLALASVTRRLVSRELARVEARNLVLSTVPAPWEKHGSGVIA